MSRFYFAVTAFVLLAAPSASGQYFGIVSACNRDATEFCNTTQSQRNQFAECIKVHFEEFSEQCKIALVKISAVRKACKQDIEQRCATTEIGAGRLFLCVKQHYPALSEPCKDAIGHAALKRLK